MTAETAASAEQGDRAEGVCVDVEISRPVVLGPELLLVEGGEDGGSSEVGDVKEGGGPVGDEDVALAQCPLDAPFPVVGGDDQGVRLEQLPDHARHLVVGQELQQRVVPDQRLAQPGGVEELRHELLVGRAHQRLLGRVRCAGVGGVDQVHAPRGHEQHPRPRARAPHQMVEPREAKHLDLAAIAHPPLHEAGLLRAGGDEQVEPGHTAVQGSRHVVVDDAVLKEHPPAPDAPGQMTLVGLLGPVLGEQVAVDVVGADQRTGVQHQQLVPPRGVVDHVPQRAYLP